ncbi:MAG TPA: flagellar protein FliS [Lachnospiraceae bacterium]|nr:flagellar protein FliS [Lachnospiraceae bacterium]
MTSESKQRYTLRITQANKTELILILYEMLLDYVEEAYMGLEQGDVIISRDAIRKAKACLEELISSLNLQYKPAPQLLSLYLYCNRKLIKADARNEKEPLYHIQNVIQQLLKAYRELAKQDHSGPVMENSQTVYAGLTYGKDRLAENMADQGLNRGFRA